MQVPNQIRLYSNPSFNDKVFQLLIDLKNNETFDIEKKVAPANRGKFYEIVQYFRESEFCNDFEIIMTETFLKKRKKGKCVLVKDLPIKEKTQTPELIEEKPTNTKKDERSNNLHSEQGSLF